MSVSVAELSPSAVAARLDDVAQVYLEMFSLRPEVGPRFAAMLAEHAARQGFRICAALDGASGQLVGFGYGFTGQPGQPFRDALAAAMGPVAAEQWLTGHFEFAEFGVIPARRRQGIGGRLHDALFSGLPHRRAVLTMRTGQQPAREFYEGRGWVTLYHDFFAPSGSGPYVVMGHELARGN